MLFLWQIINLFVLSALRPVTGGWVLLNHNDPRFHVGKGTRVPGVSSETDRGLLSARGAWKTYVIFLIERNPGMLVCDDYLGRRMACWRSWSPWKPMLFQPGDQVAVRVGEHDAEWRLLSVRDPEAGNRWAPVLSVIGRCEEHELAEKFPDAQKV